MTICPLFPEASAERRRRAVLIARLEEHDLAARGRRVAGLAIRVCELLDLSILETAGIASAALVYDPGHLALPPGVLDGPGPLGRDARLAVREHPAHGERLVYASGGSAQVATTVRHHHERWDGTGYPDRLRGEATPIAARVVGVCSAFVAMTEHRPHRPALPKHDALTEIAGGLGTEFDPRVGLALIATASAAAGTLK